MLVAHQEGMLDSRKCRRVFTEVSTVLVVAFLAVNVHPYEAPEPLWTPEDLPTVIEAADNGWLVVTAPYEHEIPNKQFWQRVEHREGELHEFMATDAAREALEQVDAARRLPAFVDVCQPDQSCTSLPWLARHRIAALRAVDLANMGEVAESGTLLRDLIHMDVDHLESAHSRLSFLIALANLGEALDRADMIASRLGPGELAELARELEAVDVEAIDLENVVIGDYLAQLHALDSLDRGEPDVFEQLGVPVWSGWLCNRALTLRSVNDRFEDRWRSATEHDTFAALGGSERSPKQDLGWWFRNPVGKVFLDLTIFDPESMAASIDEDLAAIGQTRARLLTRQ